MNYKLLYTTLLFLLSVAVAGWACGPDYDYDSDLEISLAFSPKNSKSLDLNGVLGALGFEVVYENREQGREKFVELVNEVSALAGRNVKFFQTGREYTGKSRTLRCPLNLRNDIRDMFFELNESKLVINKSSEGYVKKKHNEWDAVPVEKRVRQHTYTDWLGAVVWTVFDQCDVGVMYYPHIKQRENVVAPKYISPRNDELFKQLVNHPELHNYAILVEALVLIHEGDTDQARNLSSKVIADSKDDKEVNIARALSHIELDINATGVRYVIDAQNHSDYSWGRCASNTVDNAISLVRTAANDQTLADDDYNTLVGWRNSLLKYCNAADSPSTLIDGPARDNANVMYLHAVHQFYAGQYEQAAKTFSKSEKQGSPWVAEASKYLVARNKLLAAQVDWDPNRSPAVLKTSYLNAAYDTYKEYIDKYPNGSYVNSARGMLRRVHYLKGDKEVYEQLLIEELGYLIENISLKDELDTKDRSDILALVKEYELRTESSSVETLVMFHAILNHADLKNIRELSSLASEIEYLLLAFRAYDNGDVSFFEQNQTRDTKLRKYHGIVAARAFEQSGRYEAANEQWDRIKPLLAHPSDSELSIAANIMRSGSLADLLTSPYELRDDIIAGYLSAHCGESEDISLLGVDLSERRRALVVHDLAMRKLTSFDIAGLQAMYDELDDKSMGGLSVIRTAVKMIATGSDSGKGYMNIGYFLAKHGKPYTNSSLHEKQLESTINICMQTDGRDGSYTYFLRALKEYESSSSEDEAKTLHFLVMCRKPGANRLSCWGSGDSKDSKTWHTLLHDEYPNSKWAKRTPYFYD